MASGSSQFDHGRPLFLSRDALIARAFMAKSISGKRLSLPVRGSPVLCSLYMAESAYHNKIQIANLSGQYLKKIRNCFNLSSLLPEFSCKLTNCHHFSSVFQAYFKRMPRFYPLEIRPVSRLI